MEISTVSCNSCGAALQVDDSSRFVTCRHCGAQLEVKRNDSTLSTEVLNRIDQRTAVMAENLTAIRRDAEIERIDREWSLRQRDLMVSNKNGSTSTPSTIAGIMIIVIGGGFGLFWTIMTASMMSSAATTLGSAGPGKIASFFPCFGVLFFIAAVASGVTVITKASRYQDEEQQYRKQREAMLSEDHTPSP